MAVAIVLLNSAAGAVESQEPELIVRRTCLFARASPGCSLFTVTNFGYYFMDYGAGASDAQRGAVDLGLMLKLGRRNAVGATWFISHDGSDMLTGPMLRYRRWVSGTASVDLGIGINTNADDFVAGGAIGLVKFNPVDWVGIGIRPGIVRQYGYSCTGAQCEWRPVQTRSLLLGVEFGGKPGLIATLTVGVLVGALSVLF